MERWLAGGLALAYVAALLVGGPFFALMAGWGLFESAPFVFGGRGDGLLSAGPRALSSLAIPLVFLLCLAGHVVLATLPVHWRRCRTLLWLAALLGNAVLWFYCASYVDVNGLEGLGAPFFLGASAASFAGFLLAGYRLETSEPQRLPEYLS